MSIPVELPQLADTLARYRWAYLLTSPAQGAPHAVAVQPQLVGGCLRVAMPGRRSCAHAQTQPAVALVWPPSEEGGYSLIVDGTARFEDDQLSIVPTRAVLHRSAPAPQAKPADGCGSDCVALGLPPGDGRSEPSHGF